MLHEVPPARQQAHDLIDRLTPVQLAALIDLLGSLPAAGIPASATRLVSAPFSDEPAAELEAHEGSYPQDSDFWPEAAGAVPQRQPS